MSCADCDSLRAKLEAAERKISQVCSDPCAAHDNEGTSDGCYSCMLDISGIPDEAKAYRETKKALEAAEGANAVMRDALTRIEAQMKGSAAMKNEERRAIARAALSNSTPVLPGERPGLVDVDALDGSPHQHNHCETAGENPAAGVDQGEALGQELAGLPAPKEQKP